MKKNEVKKNNKGFSLVELIVVIAIMAVLIGVLAPQFIKYVEKSRISTDIQNVDQIKTAVEVWCAENSATGNVFTLTDNAKSATVNTAFTDAMTQAGLSTTITFKSGNWKGLKMDVSATGVVVTGEAEYSGKIYGVDGSVKNKS